MAESDSSLNEEASVEQLKSPRNGSLTSSVGWGYVFGFLLMLFVLLILLPEADGPSPWDPVAFKSETLKLIANFRILRFCNFHHHLGCWMLDIHLF